MIERDESKQLFIQCEEIYLENNFGSLSSEARKDFIDNNITDIELKKAMYLYIGEQWQS